MSETKPLTPAEARRLWVEALRSGKYEQTDMQLRNGNKFCVLGTACDLYAKNTGLGHWDDCEFYVEDSCVPYDAVLPDAVAKWLGLRESQGEMNDGQALDELNDDGVSFPELADLIESNPPGLFVEEERA